VCPSNCIYVEPAENPPDNRVSGGERYAKDYRINMERCIFCGFCEEACPVGAIVMGKEYELTEYERKNFMYAKDRMLIRR
jgi:NADH-quinone oxidoreductase subunit I